MQISFYVLANHYGGNPSNPHEALLNFVCKLTQTVLKKSELGLVIIDDNIDRLKKLDEYLWSFEAVSFIPHSLLSAGINDRISPTNPSALSVESNANFPLTDASFTIDGLTQVKSDNIDLDLNDLAAPVILTTQMPVGFDGVVLNLAAAPLFSPSTSTSTDSNSETSASDIASVSAQIEAQILPQRILEIIAPDEMSKQQGRDKYKFYQSQGWSLTYHPIN
ncbi:MAG: DNA polymerase III subunit chi [Psychrobacter sp.]|nr:DNA polymerase III subunit chi [Psychrobacter sp.]